MHEIGKQVRQAEKAAQAQRIIVRETRCKTILNRTSISDYSLNCYTGCTHGCIYCYARFMQRFHPHPEPWGEFVDVKVNAVEVLKRQLQQMRPGEVFVSSACDGWQPIENSRRLTRACCELLMRNGFQVNVLTKSSLILRDLDVFSGHQAQIGITLTTLDESLSKLWEPGSSIIEERFHVIEEAHRKGLRTAVMFGPLLPFLSDGPESIDDLFQKAADLRIDVIWVDALNARPRVWPSVSRLLNKKFPELLSSYRAVLFEHSEREAYLNQLRSYIIRAAKKFRLTDRLAGYP